MRLEHYYAHSINQPLHFAELFLHAVYSKPICLRHDTPISRTHHFHSCFVFYLHLMLHSASLFFVLLIMFLELLFSLNLVSRLGSDFQLLQALIYRKKVLEIDMMLLNCECEFFTILSKCRRTSSDRTGNLCRISIPVQFCMYNCTITMR